MKSRTAADCRAHGSQLSTVAKSSPTLALLVDDCWPLARYSLLMFVGLLLADAESCRKQITILDGWMVSTSLSSAPFFGAVKS